MALNIKNGETDRLVRELADATGESITVAVRTAVEERLSKVGNNELRRRRLLEEVSEIAERYSALPKRDDRTPDEIIGYDDRGLPT